MRLLLPLILGAVFVMPSNSSADDPVVFISAFAAGEKGAIHAFRFDSKTGTLKPQHQTTNVQHPFFLVISPDGRFLYSIDTDKFGGKEDEFVAAYSIKARTGKLERLNRQSAKGTASCYLDIDSTGKTVVLANYSTGSVAALPVQADGSLGEATSFVQHEGSSVNPKRQKAPYAHSIVISPDNRFALAADLGIDKVLIYRLDAATSKLSANEAQSSVSVEPGSGPRHLTRRSHSHGRREDHSKRKIPVRHEPRSRQHRLLPNRRRWNLESDQDRTQPGQRPAERAHHAGWQMGHLRQHARQQRRRL